jgi:hypothetical protein
VYRNTYETVALLIKFFASGLRDDRKSRYVKRLLSPHNLDVLKGPEHSPKKSLGQKCTKGKYVLRSIQGQPYKKLLFLGKGQGYCMKGKEDAINCFARHH